MRGGGHGAARTWAPTPRRTAEGRSPDREHDVHEREADRREREAPLAISGHHRHDLAAQVDERARLCGAAARKGRRVAHLGERDDDMPLRRRPAATETVHA